MYDICVIGAGPGGYVAAIKAARLGAKVALVEKDFLGGTCLNKGCIPTKALAKSAEILANIRSSQKYGINVDSFALDFKKVMLQKDEIVSRLRSGIDYLIKARKIDLFRAQAHILAPNKIKVGEQIIESQNIIIATGSQPKELPIVPFDGKDIISSDQMLELGALPESLIIIGAGVIGCEFASIFSEFGTKVTLIEALGQILPTIDREISKKMEIIFKKKGIQIYLNAKIEKVAKDQGNIRIDLNDGKATSGQKVLVCVGRRPDCENIGLENAGIKIEKGRILVDEFLRTSAENIYAVGDCTGQYWLAHTASYQGIKAIENILKQKSPADYSAVPNCIYTDPEIATIGISESQAKEQGIEYKVGKFPFQALGRAHTARQTEGFCKIIIDPKTGRILGAGIMGEHATDLISELALAIRLKATVHDLEEMIHPHPTFSEAIGEAASSIFHGAIHLP